MWRELPAGSPGEEVLAHIMPLVVRSEAEQERFWEKRATYAQLLGLPLTVDETTEAAAAAKDEETITEDTTPPSRRRYLLLSLLAAIVLSVALWWLVPPPAVEEAAPSPVPVDTTQLIVGCRDSTALNYDPLATADCDDCCLYERIGCRDSLALNFDPRATADCADCCEYPTRASLSSLAQRDSVSWKPTPPTFSVELPELTPVETGFLAWLARYKTWLSWLIPILLLSLIFGWWLWRRARRDYLARQSRSEEPPYRLPIKIRRDRRLELDERFFYILDRLRGREAGERQRIDIPVTIKATARSGGFPELRFRAFSRPTDYLILIDKQAEHNHQSQLFEYIYQHFVRQEVYAERYFFDGDPRWCWNDQHPRGLPLEQLLQRHGQARLLVFADGYSFINPVTGALEPWVKLLESWSNRALLTPAATGNWNHREGRLGQSFLILPTSIRGMLQLVRHFEQLSTPSLREWKYELEVSDRMVSVDEKQVVADLRRQLPPGLVRWVAACAIYPELHWDLTLEIGEAQRQETDTPPAFREVRQLARLPWFRTGYMPQEVRSQLLESDILTEEDDRAVRAAIVRILLANAPENQNSYAYEEHQLHLALNQLLLSQLPAERQRWLRRYRELHGRGLREDMVSMAALDRQYHRRLDFLLPRALMQRLFANGRRVLGWRSIVPLVVALLLGAGVWGLVRMVPDPCSGEIVSIPTEPAVYCLDSREDSLAYFAHLSSRLIDGQPSNGEVELYVRLKTQQFAEVMGPEIDGDDWYRLYATPLAAIYWNRGREAYEGQDYLNAAGFFEGYGQFMEKAPVLPDSSLRPPTYLAALEWAGRSYVFAGQTQRAVAVRDSIAAVDPVFFRDRSHTLENYLAYEFLDSTSFQRIRVRREGQYGFLDAGTGLATWEGSTPTYDHALNYFLDTLTSDTLALITQGGRQCLVGLDETIDPDNCFTRLIRFQDPATRWYGYANERNVTILPARYEEAGEFTDDELAWVRLPGEGYGYIRSDGSALLARNELEEARDFQQGLAAVRRQGLWGYLNTRGEMAIPTQYNTAGDFNARGRAEVSQEGRSFTIDRDGRCVAGDCPLIELRGRVLAMGNRSPIAGAAVQAADARDVTDASLASLEPLTTDADGYFQLSLSRPPEVLKLRVTASGYRDTILRRTAAAELPAIYLQAISPTPTDRDNDGAPDATDRCPDTPGLAALQGCPDTDQDGIPDIEDNCPEVAGVATRQGCPDGPAALTIADIATNMVRVEGGTFTMGCQDGRDTGCWGDEKPPHEVTVSTFSISKYEVTQAQWRAVMGSDPPELYNKGCDLCPVERVSWDDIQEFLRRLNTRTGRQYRLPTEAEWEYAARGGARSRGYLYSGSNDIDAVAWYDGNYKQGNTFGSEQTTRPVGGKQPNELGLYDMSGNVNEWCEDDWHGSYEGAPTDGRAWIDSPRGAYRVHRGGSWGYYPRGCRAASRNNSGPSDRGSLIGFRLALS